MGGDDSRFSFRLLKKQVSIGQVLDAYGLSKSLTARGKQLYGPCPVHGGDNPTAFRVDLHRGMWRCFTVCGGGDSVELVRRIEGCGYAEAARHLCRLAHTEHSTPAPCARGHRSAALFRPFQHRIRLNPRVSFLQQRKGVTVSTASSFEAGCTDRSVFLRGTVAVRLHDLQGHALGYCGRRLQHSEIARWGKWRFPRGFPKSECLYNAHRAAAARAGGIVVVECPWAVMRLAQAGIPGAVALLGTAISDIHTKWLAGASRVLLLLDGDNAGRRASVAIARRLAGSAVIHELAEGQEPEDLSDRQLARLVAAHLPLL
jgi:DNA primase